MQFRSENQRSESETRLFKKLAKNPRKRKSFVDLTNEKIKRTCKEAKKDVLTTAIRKQYRTRSYLRKISAIGTKRPKSNFCSGISVSENADADVIETTAVDVLATETHKQYRTRSYLRKTSASETKRSKSNFCDDISVFEDADADDTDATAADVLVTATRKQYRTRSYLRKISAIETKRPKSKFCEEISVFEDADDADNDATAANAELPPPAPRLPTSVRNFDNDRKSIEARCYATDLRNFFFERERKFRPSIEAINKLQTDITRQNRALLLDWIIDVVEEFTLSTETLFIAVNLIDRTLSKINILRVDLQLLGVTCLHLAAKYMEDRGTSPTVEEFAEVTDYSCQIQEILEMEKTVLQCLDFELNIPTAHAFLTRFLRCGPSSQQEGALAEYLSELFLMDINVVKYKASVVAASAMCLAKLLLRQRDGDEASKQPLWDQSLEYHTQSTVPELHECVQDMHRHHCKMQDKKLQALHEKYSESNLVANRNAVVIKPLASLPFGAS